jgi:ribosomal protein S18 acetylase RimI-like enzyme
MAEIAIGEWDPDVGRATLKRPPTGNHGGSLDDDLDALAEVLHAVVHDGAGVSFVVPFSLDEAREFWVQAVLPAVRARRVHVVVARQGERIVGTVQLHLAWPPNQPHRADVAKLLVHPTVRGRGIARALMQELEHIAMREGRTLLTLDTWTGSVAERLYRSMGYIVVGVIPRYARGSTTPELEPTTIMYKELSPAGS